MSQKGDVRKDSKEKSRVKGLLKSKQDKNATKSVNPSGRKVLAHSGLYFQIKIKKPADVTLESKREQVDDSSSSSTENERQKAKKEDESKLLASMENLEISTRPAVALCDTKSHTYEKIANNRISHECQGTACKCSKNIELLQDVCSTQRFTKPEHPEVGNDAKGLNSTLHSKSTRSQQIKNNGVKEEKKERAAQPVCSELQPKNRRLSKLRPPSTYRCKPTSISKTQHVDVVSQSTTASSVDVTMSKCRSNTGSSSEPMIMNTTEPKCFSNIGPSSEHAKISSAESEYTSNTGQSSELTNIYATESEFTSNNGPSSEHTDISSTQSECISNTGPSSELTNRSETESECTSNNRPSSDSTSVLATEPKCISNTEPSNEPTTFPVSESSSSSKNMLINSDANKSLSPTEPSNAHLSLPSGAIASDLTSEHEFQSPSRPAFWPPSVPTYKVIYSLEPSTVPASVPLSPLKCEQLREQNCEPSPATKTVPASVPLSPLKCEQLSEQNCEPSPATKTVTASVPLSPLKCDKLREQNCEQSRATKTVLPHSSESSKIAKMPQKRVSTSRIPRIPKINQIPGTNTTKQTKTTEKKIAISQKRSCK